MSARRDRRINDESQICWPDLARDVRYNPGLAARRLGISSRHLQRICRKDLGQSPARCFLRWKMYDAAQAIIGGLRVKVVALEFGYRYLSNFSRDFKRVIGCPPRDLQE